MAIWSLLEGPFVSFLLAGGLAFTALSLISEYKKVFRANPRAALSIEMLLNAIAGSGGPGFFAALLLVGALLCVASGLFSLAFNLSSYFGGAV
ncbi:hypothetical protein [Azoarcus sp. KH32C]|uniref:hypothetical protein n=1 Tax=Azoarcus sp. KH32C TaxID=748247 RepID=UPI0012EA2074|nr:hypothetical protein [Azoarcus sp. KH32C]